MGGNDRDELPGTDHEESGRRVSWHRVLGVGGWLVLVFAVLIHVRGPFWRTLDPWFERIDEALLAQDWENALAATRYALDVQPNDGGLVATAGHAHLRLGDPDSAAARFERAIELDPSRTDARLGLTEARLMLGDEEEAAVAIRPVTPDALDPPSLRLYATLLEALGQERGALEALERLPEPETRSDRVRLYRSLGASEEAVRVQRTIVDAAPEDPGAHRELAWLLAELGLMTEAEAEYRWLIEAADVEDDALRYAWVLNLDGRYAEALAVLEDPVVTSPEALALRIQTLIWSGNVRQAEYRLGVALEAHPSAAGLLALLEDLNSLRLELDRRARIAAERDTPPTEPERALQFWTARLEADPANDQARAETIALLEQFGRFAAARDVLAAGPEAAQADRGTLRHLAELSAWAGDPAGEARWLIAVEEAGGTLSDTEELALTRALLASDRPAEASRRFASVAGSEAADSSVLVLASRVAEGTGDLEALTRALEALRQRFDVTDDQLRRLGDAHRALGRHARAADAYDELHVRAPDDAEAAATLGDLRSELGDPLGAIEAYEAAEEAGASVGLRLAGAWVALGRPLEAVETYRTYVAANPDDVEARVLLARVLAEIGLEEEAIPHYLRYVEDGAADVSLEVAQAYLAIEDYAEAETWADRAVAADPGWDARMVRAQALRFLGERGEAGVLLDSLSERDVEGVAGALWRARIAWLRDRPVEVQQILEPVLDDESSPSAAREGFLRMADAAYTRGDFRRAADAIRSARDAGAPEHHVERIERPVVRGLRPSTAVRMTVASDAAEVGHTGITGVARARFGGSGIGRVEVAPHMTSQGSADVDVTEIEVGLDSVFVSRELIVSAAAGFQIGSDTDSDVTMRLESDYTFGDASALGLRLTRDVLWSGAIDPGPIRLMRLRTVTPLTLGVVGNDVRVRGTKALGIGRSVHVEGGYTAYSDDNERAYGYAQLQLPLESSVDRWLALQPNLYVEDFATQADGYVSPSGYASLGLRGQAIWGDRDRRLRLEVNPHVFRFAADEGIGIEADIEWVERLGPATLLLRGLYFNQGDLYDTARLTVGLSTSLGGS